MTCGYKMKKKTPSTFPFLALTITDTAEPIQIEDYSSPPELPDVMKPHDGTVPGEPKK